MVLKYRISLQEISHTMKKEKYGESIAYRVEKTIDNSWDCNRSAAGVSIPASCDDPFFSCLDFGSLAVSCFL